MKLRTSLNLTTIYIRPKRSVKQKVGEKRVSVETRCQVTA